MGLLRDLYETHTPAWLQDDDEGGPVLYSLGYLAEAMRERVRAGLLARFPQYTPVDAMSKISGYAIYPVYSNPADLEATRRRLIPAS